VLVTGGGAQSNHARMTAAAANRLGLDCHLAVGGKEPSVYSGNLLLDRVLGATLHFTGADSYYEVESAIEDVSARLTADGRRPFSMPIGGASVTGAAAFVDAADELLAQADRGGDDEAVDWIVVADGSGGTHAGLVAGLGDAARVLGVDVGTRPDLDDVIPRLATEAAARTGRAAPHGELVLDHARFGDGYGAITDGALEAIERVASLEGVILDPVYTGKAMAGLVAAVREGRFAPDDTVVFWHTGGAVALFARRYAELFAG
jgi:1-aminocyclopropane-1-carboxylate deaminase/D-cysteine desulfhydrase-like pyridoxal-dependent ACC family enzyme